MRTEMRDRRTGATFTQLCVGRMSDCAMPCPWPLSEGTIGDRIVFTHSPILHHKSEGSSQKEAIGEVGSRQIHSSAGVDSSGGNSSFAMATVLSEPLEAKISASLVFTPNVQGTGCSRREADRHAVDGINNGRALDNAEESQEHNQQSENAPTIILGPVIGRVEVVAQSGTVRESCCVPVLLEVDQEGDVACVVSFQKCSTSLILEMSCVGKSPCFCCPSTHSGAIKHTKGRKRVTEKNAKEMTEPDCPAPRTSQTRTHAWISPIPPCCPLMLTGNIVVPWCT